MQGQEEEAGGRGGNVCYGADEGQRSYFQLKGERARMQSSTLPDLNNTPCKVIGPEVKVKQYIILTPELTVL